MKGEDLTNMGIDLNSSFSFEDGDLVLCRYKDNLIQSVVNRINTEYGSLDLFYEEYGSFFYQYLGAKASNENLKFITLEIENVLSEESRLSKFDVDVSYAGDGKLNVNLTLYPSDSNELFEVDLITNDEGILELQKGEIE